MNLVPGRHFADFTDGKPHRAHELDVIILRNHAPQPYTVHDMITSDIISS